MLFYSGLGYGQVKAVTDKGDEVILYSDGTWKYLNQDNHQIDSIALNPNAFVKPATSTFLVKSKNADFGVWLDPKKWSFVKGKDGEVAEYEFEYKGDDIYGMFITEKVEVPLENLSVIALENAKDAAPDVQIMHQEYRMVNDKKVLTLQMNGTMQGIKFSYYGYYFSSEVGTVQFVMYTSANLLKNSLPAMESLLNGFVWLQKK